MLILNDIDWNANHNFGLEDNNCVCTDPSGFITYICAKTEEERLKAILPFTPGKVLADANFLSLIIIGPNANAITETKRKAAINTVANTLLLECLRVFFCSSLSTGKANTRKPLLLQFTG